jgi:hypothetical protein
MTTVAQPDTEAEFDPFAELDFYADTAGRIGQSRVVLAPIVDGVPKFDADLLDFEAAPDSGLTAAEIARMAIISEDFHITSRGAVDHAGVRAVSGFTGQDFIVHRVHGPAEYAKPAAAFLKANHDKPIRKRLVAANDNAPRAGKPVAKPRFDLTWFDDIAESEPKESLIQGAFGVGEFSTVSGLPGTGKSVIITDAACHVAAGLEWHGRKVQAGLVVYVAAERANLTKRRMMAFKKRHGIESAPLLVLGGKLDMTSSTVDTAALIEAIKVAERDCGERCIWVIVDTLTRTFGAGDQNTSKDMVKYVSCCDEVVRQTGAHLTVVHHTAWSGERGKGAIDLDGAVDASFLVKKTGKTYTLECNGTNDGEEGTIVNFKMESVELGVDKNGDTFAAPVVISIGAGPADSLMAALRGHAANVFNALTAAIELTGIEPVGDHFPDDVLVVTEDQWRAAYYGTDPVAKQDTMAKRFLRARSDMLAAGAVKQIGQWYWPE